MWKHRRSSWEQFDLIIYSSTRDPISNIFPPNYCFHHYQYMRIMGQYMEYKDYSTLSYLFPLNGVIVSLVHSPRVNFISANIYSSRSSVLCWGWFDGCGFNKHTNTSMREFTQRTALCVCVCVSCTISAWSPDNRTVILVKPPAQPRPAPHIFHLTTFACFASFSPSFSASAQDRWEVREHSFILNSWADSFSHSLLLRFSHFFPRCLLNHPPLALKYSGCVKNVYLVEMPFSLICLCFSLA